MFWPGLGFVWLRYGSQASQATDSAIQSVTNVGITAFNMENLALNAVLKCAGNQMPKASTVEYQTKNPEKRAKGDMCEKK